MSREVGECREQEVVIGCYKVRRESGTLNVAVDVMQNMVVCTQGRQI